MILIYSKFYQCIELDDVYDDNIPSSYPSSYPSTNPSSKPTTVPSLQPTVTPSSQPTAVPSLHPTIHPPTSHPTPPLQYLGINWWYLIKGTLTLYGSETDISEDKVLTAIESSIKFVLTDELIDKEKDDVIINIENNNNNNNNNRILLDSNNNNNYYYDDDNYDYYKDLIPLYTVNVYAWCSEKSTALKLKTVFRRINKRPLLIIQPLHMNKLHTVSFAEIDDVSITVDTIGPSLTAEKFSPDRIIYVIIGTIMIFIIGASVLNRIIKHHRYLKQLSLFLIQLSIDAVNEIIHIFSQLYEHNNNTNNNRSYNFDNKNKSNWQELNEDDEDNVVKFTINDSEDDDENYNKNNINPILNENMIELKNISNQYDDEETYRDNNGSPI